MNNLIATYFNELLWGLEISLGLIGLAFILAQIFLIMKGG